MKALILFVVCALFFLSCEKDEMVSSIGNDKEVIAKLKSKTVDTLVIGTSMYVLDAYIWRDFMPVSPPGGKPMNSINWLVNVNLQSIPDNLTMVKQYVIYNDSVWISDYEIISATSQPPHKMEAISRNGPHWGPGVSVEVVSLIRDSSTGKDYFLSRKDVNITQTF